MYYAMVWYAMLSGKPSALCCEPLRFERITWGRALFDLRAPLRSGHLLHRHHDPVITTTIEQIGLKGM